MKRKPQFYAQTGMEDGAKVFLGGCDNKAFMWDLASNQAQQVGEHASAINGIAFFRSPTAGELVVTCSWDKTLKFWDVRQPKMILSHTLSEKVSCMDVKYPLCAVATEDKKVTVFNLEQPQNPFKQLDTQLKLQTRSISCFSDKSGFTVGSIEGRVRVEYINPTSGQQSFAFKCHRDNDKSLAYAVNSMAFHPVHGTFATAGSDGAFHFWDKDSKQRLKQFKNCSAPITSARFNATGDLLAYAVGYDWSKGAQFYNEYKTNNHIYIHPTPESEIKPKPKKKTFR